MLDVCAVQVFPRKALVKLFYVAMFAYFRGGTQRFEIEVAFSFPCGRLREFETASHNITS